MDLFINLYGDNLNVSLNQYIDMIFNLTGG